eukprot:TRINITY_DN8150_c0_g1_i1.p1 TRINITY_DN8150_c0_g1~~TRINITY_DN8150_c0_g1_i1.p1  ORF type:complete len:1033 (+),score=403.28 TRINITY_DN8150_c0_g1_i1:85-3183(+)
MLRLCARPLRAAAAAAAAEAPPWSAQPPGDAAGGAVTPAQAGRTLVSEVTQARRRLNARRAAARSSVGRKWTPAERETYMRKLREKRLKLVELGKKIPSELLTKKERKTQANLDRLDDLEPGAVRTLRSFAKMKPEMRQMHVRDHWCSHVNASPVHVHPLAQERWLDILKAAPRGLLRHHLREIVPVLDDRMRESRFHQFYDSTDEEILKRKGLVFEGRDGKPLPLNLEELRMAREAELYKKIDPRAKSRLRWAINRRISLQSKRLPTAPTFRPLVYSQGDCLAYFGYRMFPYYSVLLRVFVEITSRVPQFMPRSMLDFGAGWGTAMFCAREVWCGLQKPPRLRTKQQELQWKRLDGDTAKDKRHLLKHPRIQDAELRAVFQEVIGAETARLTAEADEAAKLVAQGQLPSGAEVELRDLAAESQRVGSPAVWRAIERWRGDEDTGEELGEDFLGTGTYTGETKPFSTTDYFLEGEVSDYPMPKEAQDLIDRGLSVKQFLQHGDDSARHKWAADYHKHLEREKMARDPTYRPFAASQYLNAKAVGWPIKGDPELASSRLHEDDPPGEEEGAIVYRGWEKREKEVLAACVAVEPSNPMMQLGMDFLGDTVPNVKWQRFLPEQPKAAGQKHDLCVAAYTLGEFQSEELRADAIRSLWEHCSGVLVVVEPGTPAGFKLVLDARRTILEEYKDIGPWESQPTVLAPCPHDNLRCPVEHSMLGHRFKELRTCYSVSDYYASFVEEWVHQELANRQHVVCEQYSYVVIARNDVVPRKSTRHVAPVEPTVVTEDPSKMADDPVLKKVLSDPAERALWNQSTSRREVPGGEQLYPVDEPLPIPETEFNLRPFVGTWYEYNRPLTVTELLAVKEELAGYEAALRDKHWEWSRVVRNVVAGRKSQKLCVDVCTPHGTQERMWLNVSKGVRSGYSLASRARAGALFPNFGNIRREEWVQAEKPNTFVQPKKTLYPLLFEDEERRMKMQEEERLKAEAEGLLGPELADRKRRAAEELRSTAADPDEADRRRAELRAERAEIGPLG